MMGLCAEVNIFQNKNIPRGPRSQWPLISVALVAVAAEVSEILESIFRLSILEFRAFAPKIAMVVFFQSCQFVVKVLSEEKTL